MKTAKDINSIFVNGSESFRKLNPHLVAGEVLPQASGYELPKSPYAEAEKPAKKRLRQSSATMNKTEQAFFDMMVEYYGTSIRWQPLTLRLANGVRYTPDAVLFAGSGESGKLFAYEVKGFMRDDAAVKLKVAAHTFPEIIFHLVTKKKGGAWDIERVLA